MHRVVTLAALLSAILLATACEPPECTCLCVDSPAEATPGVTPPPAPAAEDDRLGYNYDSAVELQTLGEHGASLLFVERVMNEDPEYRDIHFLRGFAMQMTDRADEAVRSYEQHLARFPDEARTLYNLGYAHMTAGNWPACVDALQRNIEADANARDVHFHIATCFDALGQAESASRHRAIYEGTVN